ncbi:MAG: arginine--tRNA ligase [Thermofilum sp. ex4484_15]|nr:MAG: arginine--tRNA ligase [Thermofilum sp. ex4484_15]
MDLKKEVYDPLGYLKEEVKSTIKEVIGKEIELRRAPKGLGDYAVPLVRAIKGQGELEKLLSEVSDKLSRVSGISRIELVRGFLNISLNYREVAKAVFKSVDELGERYGYNPVAEPKRILIEFLSANPIHPLHIGHLRNALLGEALSKLLRLRGHSVEKHFYVNDAGLQISIAAYGFSKVGFPSSLKVKPDEYIGLIYSCVNALLTIRELKRRLEYLREGEGVAEVTSELDEWTAIAAKLRERDPVLFDKLADELNKEDDPKSKIAELNRRFEKGDLEAVRLVRDMCKLVIKGFNLTLRELGISFDSWDWESEVTLWNGLTEEVINRLRRCKYLRSEGGSLVLDGDSAIRDTTIKEELGLTRKGPLPPLTLTRSDGTTLYPIRDVAYSIWKFERCKADIVINVIGVEQTLPQLYVKIALWLLGYKEEARNLIHYSYEAVKVPGYRMSARKGRFISVDELIREAKNRALMEIERRGLSYTTENVGKIAKAVGLGAIKYAILSVAPNKVINFDWDRALDFNRNSGPFVQYAYVRASSILRKADVDLTIDIEPHLQEDLERELLIEVGEWPGLVAKAADELRVDMIANYAYNLAKLFNTFYERLPVLSAKGDVKLTRLKLVKCVKTVLGNALNILGIEAPERM